MCIHVQAECEKMYRILSEAPVSTFRGHDHNLATKAAGASVWKSTVIPHSLLVPVSERYIKKKLVTLDVFRGGGSVL